MRQRITLEQIWEKLLEIEQRLEVQEEIRQQEIVEKYAAKQNGDALNRLLNVSQLAAVLNVSRGTVYQWKRDGYVFQFGRRTTAEHCHNWLATRSGPTAAEIAAVDEKLQQLERRQRNKRRNS